MESQALLLPSSSSSSSFSSSCFRSCARAPHFSAVLLQFSSRSVFSPAPCVRVRTLSRISAALGDEDQRWLREEQRWLREEQRWLREEARWHAERRLMADELALLKREVEQLRAQSQERRAFSTGAATLPSVVASLKQLVQSLPAEPRPSIEFVEEGEDEESFASSVSISDYPQTPASGSAESTTSSSGSFPPSLSIPSMTEFSIDLMVEAPAMQPRKASPRRELRKGAEGDEVKELQEALEELGFYSGEEDIEYAMFADGTETAVRTWQASIGVREDGVASPALLAVLLGESEPNRDASSNGRQMDPQDRDPWEAPPAAVRGSEAGRKKTFAEDKMDVESTQHGQMAANRRVFLLGENRWEEPGRLTTPRAKAGNNGNGAGRFTEEKCFSCKGEGVCMCTECEGTGELNVEDQFLDWVEEGAKCPYCEGSGAIPCDVCAGRGVAAPV